MKCRKFLIALLPLLFMASSIANAHPGRTDSKGGHYCRTNCAKWGLKDGEYHYHNGNGNGSNTTTSNTKPSASSNEASTTNTAAKKEEKVPEGAIEVKMPAFQIYLNDELIDNARSKYPVFVYKNITYFPMTWNYTQALGIKTAWNAETGFTISKTENLPAQLKQEEGTTLESKIYAKIPEFNIYVNDNLIDNASEEYPVLVYNNITYFPMTWKFAVEELELKIKFDSNTFHISK